MQLRRILILGALLTTVFMCQGPAARAEFITVENFELLALGPIDDQNGWHAADVSSEVTVDPVDNTNQVLTVVTESTFLFRETVIPEGTTRMVFLRFRYEDQLNASFGLSESTVPDQFGNFEPELNLTSTNDELRINDDGFYTDLTVLEPGRWYNCWLFIDNANDHTSVWLHGRVDEPATQDDRLSHDEQTEFLFRQGTINDLRNFYIKTGGGDGIAGPLRIDDIHIESTEAVNLVNPVAPVSATLVATAALELRGAWPNPFNPLTTIAFALDTAQSIELAVFDLRGRQVRLLGEGWWETGPHAVTWNGEDDAGAGVASGVYLVRLKSRREAHSTKIILAR